MRQELERFIRWVMRDTTFRVLYSASIELDHGDGTVDLLPDDDRIRGRGMQRVPKAAGIAADQSLVSPGTRCLVGFANGDPRHPTVLAFEYRQGTAVVRLDDGAAGLARVGDTVRVATTPALQVSATIQGTNTVPGAPPVVTTIPPTPFVGTLTIPPTPSITGTINDGAAGVKA